ncbi:hypothetical protein DFS34DRAFT_369046 [Phlyctochytrium arcticum]|nr:hypothetical protein DFS34DRAFT_369046 [Phlyctochytrium arcticum]
MTNRSIKQLSTIPFEPQKPMFFRKDQLGNDQVLEWKLDEYLAKQGEYPYLSEFVGKLDEHSPICAFVDCDTEVVKDCPTDEEEEEVRQFVIQAFKNRLYNKESEYSLVFAFRDKNDLAVKKKKSGHKISWRIFSNLVTTRAEITKYFPTENLPEYLKDFKGPLFDVSVYQNMRKMCFVDKQKSPSDSRILQRVDDESLDKFLIQNIQPDFNKAVWNLDDHMHVESSSSVTSSVKKEEKDGDYMGQFPQWGFY